MEEEEEEENGFNGALPFHLPPHTVHLSGPNSSISLLLYQLVTTSILTCRRHPIMSLLIETPWILHIQQMLLANELNKWDATFLPPFHAFAELTFHCLKVSARKIASSVPLDTSIYPFYLQSSPSARWMKNGNECTGCEEVKSVLPQSVTNASLDIWRGHSSLLSPGHSIPLYHLLLTRTFIHTCIIRHSHSWHSHVLYTLMYAQTHKHPIWLLAIRHCE